MDSVAGIIIHLAGITGAAVSSAKDGDAVLVFKIQFVAYPKYEFSLQLLLLWVRNICSRTQFVSIHHFDSE